MIKAVVVGSGPAGATVARVLSKSGSYQVLVLEKGRSFHPNLAQVATASVTNLFANDELAWESREISPADQDPLLEPRSFRTSPSEGPRLYVGDVNNLPLSVGGAGSYYDAKSRRLREVDFVTNSLMGGSADRPAIVGTSYADWPLRYAHLEPFYAVMEEIAGVQGPAWRRDNGAVINPNPLESPRTTPFPMPPGVQMYDNLLIAEAAKRLGYHPTAVPTAVNSRPYRGRPACMDCGFCLHYGCTINAKGSGIWQLPDGLQTGRLQLLTQSTAVGIEWTRRGSPRARYRATGVHYVDRLGRLCFVAADLVIVANSPIEAVRLALASGIGPRIDESRPDRLLATDTDPSGMLGRNLTFHLQTLVMAVFNQDVHPWRGRTSTATIDDFCGSGPGPQGFDASIPRGGVVEVGGNINPITEAVDLATVSFGDPLKAMIKASPFRKHLGALTMQGEDMPQLTNYVDLDPDLVDYLGYPVPRITYHSHEYELAAQRYYAPRLMEIMDQVGATGSRFAGVHPLFVGELNTQLPAVFSGALAGLADGALPFSQVPQTKHIMGTHRMALDPEHGPCDPYGRHWAFDNLFHAGAGLFVTAPGYNPTLTIWALAYRLAAAIVAQVGQQPSYTMSTLDQDHRKLVQTLQELDPDTMVAAVLSHRADRLS